MRTRVSDGPRHRLGNGQRKMEVSSPSQVPLAHPFSGRGLPPGSFVFQRGERSNRSPRRKARTR
jgi:hypothetical protein